MATSRMPPPREIKALISRSVEQVEQGTTPVDEAGKTMQEIVGSIPRVSDIVAEISAASVEQSWGVQQVGQAVAVSRFQLQAPCTCGYCASRAR